MPRLSLSHLTAAPAMATEPWKTARAQRVTMDIALWSMRCTWLNESKPNTLSFEEIPYLQSIASRTILSKLIWDSGQQPMGRIDRLWRSSKKIWSIQCIGIIKYNTQWNRNASSVHHTSVPVLYSKKHPVPYLRRQEQMTIYWAWVSLMIPEIMHHRILNWRIFGLSFFQSSLSNQSSLLVTKNLEWRSMDRWMDPWIDQWIKQEMGQHIDVPRKWVFQLMKL